MKEPEIKLLIWAADRFRQNPKNGYLQTWTDEDLRDDIPNAEIRRSFVKELQPRPLDVYEEPIPVFAGWPDAPCLYLQFTETYDVGKKEAGTKFMLDLQPHGGRAFPNAR